MKYQTLSFYVPCGTGRNMLGISTADASSPDLDKFNEQMNNCCEKLDAAGYDIAHVVPLQIGTSGRDGKINWSITRGAAVIGRQRGS